MPHLIWTDNMNTGIDAIDSQHRRIIDYINLLYDTRVSSDRTVVEHVIAALADYITSHFEFEESMMEDAGYELTSPHKKDHQLFISHFITLQKRFKYGEEILVEILNLLSSWHIDHINHDDARYVDTVKPTIKSLVDGDSRTGWISRSLGRFFRSS